MPVARPFKIWLKRRGTFTMSSPSPETSPRLGERAGQGGALQRSDILAGGVLRRQRRGARGDDVGEVHRVLHRFLLLATHEEVGTQRLVGLRIHLHAPDEVVHLETLAGLDE